MLFVVLFSLQKPLFMILQGGLYADVSLSGYMSVMCNGLPLDFSLAGYLTIIPALLIIAAQWCKSKILRRIELVYYGIVSVLMSIVICLDIALYEYWGVRLDSTPLFYFISSPSSALASVSVWYVVCGILAIAILTMCYYSILAKTTGLLESSDKDKKLPIASTAVLVMMTAALFVPIRGGFTVSTMNLSRVYFSKDQKLNHAAINPLFSLMYSLSHQNRFSEQFRFYEPDVADEIFSNLSEKTISDSIPQLLTTSRPDIYLVILESFSSHLMSSLDGTHPVAQNLDSIAKNGILFTNFYANGYRTDRALPAILSAYPSQPTTSIMKDVTKTDKLPSIAGALKESGYGLAYYYGGDINFTNLGAYLVSSGFDKVISDKDFPIGKRLSKWGVHDHYVFERCIEDVAASKELQPQLCVIQTSSSHEPFDVPYSNCKITDKRANAFAYADSCLGAFVENLKDMGKWDDALVIITPDHYGAYPQGLENPVDRHRIPLIMTGGVVKKTARIDVVASQIDLAATLLHQLNLPHEQFVFSKNILNAKSPHFAFFVDPSQFGVVSDSSEVVYNCDAERVIFQKGNDADSLLMIGKAFLQKLYDDLDKR